MKHAYQLATLLLMLGILASLSSMTPTGAFAANLAPVWDAPTKEFVAEGGLVSLDLSKSFFDPDGDPLQFTVSVNEPLSASIHEQLIVIAAAQNGEAVVSASDGKTITLQKITIIAQQ